MKFSVAVLFAIIVFVAADVSHLNNKYLPPHSGAASTTHEHYESAPTGIEKSSSETDSFSVPEGASSITSSKYAAPESSVNFGSRSGFSSELDSSKTDSSFSAPESAASTSSFKTTEYKASVDTSSKSTSSFSAPEGAASGVETQYAADGGYVY